MATDAGKHHSGNFHAPEIKFSLYSDLHIAIKREATFS